MISVLMNHYASFHFSPIVALGVRRVKQRLHVADEFVENVDEKTLATLLISCREILAYFPLFLQLIYSSRVISSAILLVTHLMLLPVRYHRPLGLDNRRVQP